MAVVAVLLGMGTGFLAALAGVGGGFLYVPILILIFGLDPQDAVGTSLAVIIFTTLAASASYLRQNKVFFRSAACILPPSIIGAVAGAYLTDFISGTLITVLFSLFVGLLAIKLIFPDFPLVRAFRKGPSFIETSPDTNSFIVETNVYYVHYGIWGFLAGLASGLTGIGGGIFNVPALDHGNAGALRCRHLIPGGSRHILCRGLHPCHARAYSNRLRPHPFNWCDCRCICRSAYRSKDTGTSSQERYRVTSCHGCLRDAGLHLYRFVTGCLQPETTRDPKKYRSPSTRETPRSVLQVVMWKIWQDPSVFLWRR